jgi:hypothetical protein
MHVFVRTLGPVLLLALSGSVLAARDGKGPGDSAYEHASDNASFMRAEGKPGKGKHDKSGKYEEEREYDGEGERDHDEEHDHDRQREHAEEHDREREHDEEGDREQEREAGQEQTGSADNGGKGTTETPRSRREQEREGIWQRVFGRRQSKEAGGENQ